jgi:hypothetical protein
LTWRAKFSVGGLIGLLAIGVIVGIDGLLLNLLLDESIGDQQISFVTFLMAMVVLLSVPVLLVAIYHTLSLVTLRYRLDRNGVSVRSFGSEQIIPIRDIQRIIRGGELGGVVVRRRGLRWPGYERGVGQVPGIGRTRFLASQPLAGQLLLVTPGSAFGISPRDSDGFMKAFEARQDLGPNRLLEQEVRHARWLTWPLWMDSTAWTLLGAAAIINLGLFGYLAALFPGLDFQLPLHFNRLGQADRIGTKMELFALPIIGLIILGTNLALGLILYRRERAGSYLLWGAAAAVQALFWLAAVSIIP